MRKYLKHVRISENFPVNLNDHWIVIERGKLCERWNVVKVAKTYFVARVTEHIPEEA